MSGSRSASATHTQYTGLVLVAALIGFLGAAGSVVFQAAIRTAARAFGALGAALGAWGAAQPLAPPIVLAAGGIALLLLERIFPGHALGYGFPRFLEMVHLESGRVKRRWMIVKTLGAAISLGAGASVGREGPIAQIGGSIGSFVARLLRLEPRSKLLAACGAAAGIATTFNAPIGSVMFAQEIVLQGKVELAHFSLIVISTATAVITARALGGVDTVFQVRAFDLGAYQELVTYALMGLFLGLLAASYVRFFHATLERLARLRVGTATKLVGGLAAVGVVGAFLPKNLSDGYPVIEEALAGKLPATLMVALALAKILTSSVSLGCGAPGGVFGPIFFIGAMSGGAFRSLSAWWMPSLTGPRGSYALVGLAAFLGACTHAPLTAIFLLFETTGSHEIALPALVTVILAVIVASAIESESIDTLGLARAGTSLEPPREQIMDLIPVASAFHEVFEPIRADAPLAEVLKVMGESTGSHFPVVEGGGRLLGTLSLHGVRAVLLDPEAGSERTAGDLCDRHVPTVTLETSLGQALGRMEEDDRDALPVVASDDQTRVLGLLSRADVIRAYNRALVAMRTIPGAAGVDALPRWSKGYRVVRFEVPRGWDGRTLRELDCRARFGVSVLAVERRDDPGHTFEVPDPDHALAAGDTLVLAGPAGEVTDFERTARRGPPDAFAPAG
ncbi:MAG: chloride channel protein [Deltaproteobacteria bacterium]|nr:chloride channel protein [Deltaproteobacteria bacterium]